MAISDIAATRSASGQLPHPTHQTCPAPSRSSSSWPRQSSSQVRKNGMLAMSPGNIAFAKRGKKIKKREKGKKGTFQYHSRKCPKSVPRNAWCFSHPPHPPRLDVVSCRLYRRCMKGGGRDRRRQGPLLISIFCACTYAAFKFFLGARRMRRGGGGGGQVQQQFLRLFPIYFAVQYFCISFFGRGSRQKQGRGRILSWFRAYYSKFSINEFVY